MACPHTRPLLSIIVAIAWATTCLAQAPAARLPEYTTHEASFRRMATARTVPLYPIDAVARGITGVVVVEATAGPDRRVESVEVLQSPDEALSAATRSAVSKWTLPSVPTPSLLRAKLTFYFQIQNGKGMVLNPDQVPGNEDVFAAWTRPPAGRVGSGAPTGPPPAVLQHAGEAREIDQAEFTRLLAAPDTVVLDVRDRDQFAGGAHPRARNVPADEVLTRARAELPPNVTVVIDCSGPRPPFAASRTTICESAGSRTLRSTFPDPGTIRTIEEMSCHPAVSALHCCSC